MKQFFSKKYNNLFILVIVALISILVPSFVYVNARKAGVGSRGFYSGQYYGSYSGQYYMDNGTHNYVEPSSFNGQGVGYEIKSGDKSLKYHLYETQADVDAAKAMGACNPVPCATGAEFGFTGSRDTWGEQLKAAGNSAAKNGKSFDLSNPVSLAYAKAALQQQGYDISNMSQKDIEKLATQFAQGNNGLVSTDLMHTTVIKNTITGEYLYCPGSSECDKAAAEGFVIDAIYDMYNYDKTHAGTDDKGWVCDVEECPPDDDGPGCPDCEPGEVVPFELNPKLCSISIPDIPKPTPKPLPANSSSGGSCGSTATKKTYTSFSAGCGYVVMLKTETVTAHLPSAPNIIYAGKTFDWGEVSSIKNVSTTIWDSSELTYEMTKVKSQIQAISSVIGCYTKAMNKLKQEYATKANECAQAIASAAGSCTSCNQSCAHQNQENPGTDCSCEETCGVATEQQKVCDDLKSEYDDYIKEYELKIKGYEDDLKLLTEQLTYLNSCQSSVPNPTASTETGTVQLTNQKMELSTGYVQIINSIKGVAKNNGLPLTAADIAKIDGDTYFEVDGDFFMPYYIKNGTTGNLTGDVVGDISISGYSCPINVANYVLCEKDDCGSTPTNLDIIYRPISLTNPFPSIKDRPMGSNWTELSAKSFITNNRNVSDYDIYKLKPIYTITLTPTTIKNIRSYNKQNSLNDFDMSCTDGYKCISKFLWEKFDGIIDTNNSCASSTGWDAACYDGGVSE